MLVKDMMKKPVAIQSEQTLEVAARRMKEENVGGLPVYEGAALVGVITDRDIAMRGVAEMRNPATTKTRQAMSAEALCCLEDDTVQQAVTVMRDNHVRRLPVLDRDQHLVGMISLSDVSGDASSPSPFEVVFYKLLLNSTGHEHNVELTRFAVAPGRSRDEAVAAAIRNFEKERHVSSWKSLADGYDVIQVQPDDDGRTVETSELTERIRRRAYELWEREGKPAGRHVAHWVQACGEIDLERGRSRD